MKYVLIIVLALIILRIDMFTGVVERGWKKIPSWSSEAPVVLEENTQPISRLTIGDMQTDASSQLQLLLTEFSYNPHRATRELIVGYLKNNPSVTDISPVALFSELDKWVNNVRSENPEQLFLLNDLMDAFKGEGLKVIQQFYSLYIDDNPEFFFHYYPHTKDPNCNVARFVWSTQNILSEAMINARNEKIVEQAGKIQSQKLEFAKNCQLVLRVESSKITPSTESL